MSRSREAMEKETLNLPWVERVRLVNRLLDSLEDRPDDDPRSVQRAWIEEANRRYEAYLRGEESVIPAQRVFDELRAEQD